MNHEFPEIEIEQPKEGFPFMASLINEQIEALEELWVEFSQKPVRKTSTRLGDALTLHFATMKMAIDARRDEFSSDSEAAEPIFEYIMEIERRRTKFLNNLESTEDDETYKPITKIEFDGLKLTAKDSTILIRLSVSRETLRVRL